MSGNLEAIAMSGGVDSSVAALLRVRAGSRAVGLTMKLWDSGCDGESPDKACCTADHAVDAMRVCQKLSIPHYVLDLREDFRRDVVDVFVSEYLAGRTPNPCVRCNTYLKWDALWDRARELGCSRLSTGHYARIRPASDGPALLRGADPLKDQSYFLWGIPRALLEHTDFPLGDLSKPEIRALAAKATLPTAAKSESQDICFVPGGDYRELVRSSRPGARLLEPGPIVGPGGSDLGRHQGLASYTLGQRRGVGVAWTEPLYVTGLDPDSNTLHLGVQSELDVDTLELEQENWLVDDAPRMENLSIQVRYRSTPQACRLERGISGTVVHVSSPVLAPAPGQSMVLYQEDRVVGGGVLTRAHRSG
jgi:tRNA-uridine 2-sulfurtransferase